MYSTKCESLTGYSVPELTTSGLTHHVNTYFKIGEYIMNAATHPFYLESKIFIDYNFGLMKTQKIKDDVEIIL
jgi:hypothetical protein